MSFNGQISGSLAPQGAKTGSVSGNIGAVTPAIRDGAVTTSKIADAAVTIAKLAQDVTALINSKGDASDVATLQTDVAALQTITAGLGTASTYGVANNLTTAEAGTDVLDAAQGKALGDRLTTAEGDIVSLNDEYAHLKYFTGTNSGNGDLNDLLTPGAYYVTSGSNLPSTQWLVVFVFTPYTDSSGTMTGQLALNVNSAAMYFRTRLQSAWTAWKTVTAT